MPKSRFMLCAEGISIDQTSNNATIFSILDTIVPATFPVALPRLVVVSNFERDLEEPSLVKLRLVATLADATVMDFPVDLNFADKPRSNVSITLEAFPIHGPGKLIFAFRSDGGDVIAQYDITVNSPPVKPPQVISS